MENCFTFQSESVKIKPEEVLRVIIADVADELCEFLHIGGIQTVLDPLSDKSAENTAEIFVSRIGSEAARVGEHSEEVTERAEICKRRHLRAHSAYVIVKPPCTSLHYRRDIVFTVLEAAYERAYRLIIGGIDGIKDSSRKNIFGR